MQSIIFFPILLFFCSFFNYFGDKYKSFYLNMLYSISFILVVFLFGVRVNFGIDHPEYVSLYFNQKALWLEPGYAYINKILLKYHFPYQVLFIVISALQFGLFFQACNELKISIFWGFFFFYIAYIFSYVNIARQAIAISISFLAIAYYVNNKKKLFLLYWIIALGFHKSAIIIPLILIFTYFLTKLKFKPFIYLGIFLFVICFYDKFYDIIGELLSKILGKEYSYIFSVWKISLGSGLGVRIKMLAYFFTIPYLIDFREKDKKFDFLFNLFFIGVIGEFISSLNMNLSRLFYYFSILQVYIFPYGIKRITKAKINKFELKTYLFLLGCLLLFFLFFINSFKGILNTSIYIWDLDFSFKKPIWG